MPLKIDKSFSLKMNYDKFAFLKKIEGKSDGKRIKKLVKYFSDGKEIPYPLYKDREKVMNPK